MTDRSRAVRTELNTALKTAMRNRDQVAISTIRLILAAIKDRDIAARDHGVTDGIDDDEILGLLQTMVKQRNESIGLYEQGGRLDLVESEQQEIEVIRRFLPAQMSEQETREAVAAVITEIGAGGLKDMGRTMQALRGRYLGRMDFGKASAMAKQSLS
ncbi:MAG: GatB/YqeY domain-containing protein [Rhodospirillaceae bacterium]|nr:GatB/YqeY domain-containing protein [Rhodospirillaceae bacterium]MCA8934279.1 GatB/YqeY domain-containing protein [Rhodospirillaceae bacterium]